MTDDKRFEIVKTDTYDLYVPVDEMKVYIFPSFEDELDCIRFVDVLNDLENLRVENGKIASNLLKENEQLKDKYNEQSVQYEGLEEQVERLLDFKDNVFNLINAKIKHYEHKPFSAPVGQPMSVNFDADVDRIARLSELQDLKKELIE